MKECYIIAGGTSLKGFDFSKLNDKDVIAVNKAILDFLMAKYFVTMDYTFIDKKLKENRSLFEICPATKIFISNLCPHYMREIDGRIIDIRNNYVYRLHDFDVIIKSKREKGLGITFKEFTHGNNSGFCALQLAVCLGYEEIHLLGYDLKCENLTHYHGGYGMPSNKFNQKLNSYLDNFKIGLKILKIVKPNIKIYNYSSNNLLEEFTTSRKLEDIK